VQIEVNLECVQLRQETDEILETATETIDRPCHDHIEPTSRSIAMQPVERRPLVPPLAAADAIVSKDLNDSVAHADCCSTQFPFPIVGGLFGRRNTQINGSTH
jgi:hypothetical protein